MEIEEPTRLCAAKRSPSRWYRDLHCGRSRSNKLAPGGTAVEFYGFCNYMAPIWEVAQPDARFAITGEVKLNQCGGLYLAFFVLRVPLGAGP